MLEKTCGNCAWHNFYDCQSGMVCKNWVSMGPSTMEVETAYPQDREENEYRYISPTWLDELAKGLTKGAEKHPGETWRTIPTREHLARAMRHINLYLMGDRDEPHLVNAGMRLMMAFDTSRNETGEQDA